MNPAPMLALTSLIGRTKPVGAPFMDGTWENEYWVFAMQMGRLENPCLVYISICFSACWEVKKSQQSEAMFYSLCTVHIIFLLDAESIGENFVQEF